MMLLRTERQSALRSIALMAVAVAIGAACVPDPGGGGGPTTTAAATTTTVPSEPVTETVTIGTEVITVSVPAGLTLHAESSDPTPLPAEPVDLVFPFGAIDLDIGNVEPAGSIVRVTIVLPSAVEAVRKLVDGAWDPFVHDGTTGAELSADGLTITLDLQDGGRGDTDGSADGAIADPLAPARIWLRDGCLDSSLPHELSVDGLFNGTPNTVGNTALFSSTDGSCSGGVIGYATFVRAPSKAAADLVCALLGQNPAFSLVSAGYPVPTDSWGCPVAIVG